MNKDFIEKLLAEIDKLPPMQQEIVLAYMQGAAAANAAERVS